MALLTALGRRDFLGCFTWVFRRSQTNINSGGAMAELVFMVGIATLVRLMSDAAGAALQTSGKIFLDNMLLTTYEAIWGVGTAVDLLVFHLRWQRATGLALIAGAVVLLVTRGIMSHRYGSGLFARWWRRFDAKMVRRLLIFGGTVVAAQMADYLYAPANYLLILFLIDNPTTTVAVYTPAVQIDGGALLLVSGLASVLLPRTAMAHAAGDPHLVRRYYVRGTLATFFLLLAAAPVLWLLAPVLSALVGKSHVGHLRYPADGAHSHRHRRQQRRRPIDPPGHRQSPPLHGLRADCRHRQRRVGLLLRALRPFGPARHRSRHDRGGHRPLRPLAAVVHATYFETGDRSRRSADPANLAARAFVVMSLVIGHLSLVNS